MLGIFGRLSAYTQKFGACVACDGRCTCTGSGKETNKQEESRRHFPPLTSRKRGRLREIYTDACTPSRIDLCFTRYGLPVMLFRRVLACFCSACSFAVLSGSLCAKLFPCRAIFRKGTCGSNRTKGKETEIESSSPERRGKPAATRQWWRRGEAKRWQLERLLADVRYIGRQAGRQRRRSPEDNETL